MKQQWGLKWCFKICCRGEGGLSSDLKWRGWGNSFPPLLPRHHGFAFRKGGKIRQPMFSAVFPQHLYCQSWKRTIQYTYGPVIIYRLGGGTRILGEITWFLGEYKGGWVVTENPKGRIAENFGRIHKGDHLNLIGKWGHGGIAKVIKRLLGGITSVK